jgi:hypothetical protein
MDEATITLGDLECAYLHRELTRPARDGAGAGACTLVAHCPNCEKPSMVGLRSQDDDRALVLVPVRTAKDLEVLFRAGALRPACLRQ